MKKTIKKRAQEPSTWAGLAGLASLAGPIALLFGVDPAKAQAGVAVLGTLASVAAIAMPEKAHKPAPAPVAEPEQE
jgi:repressor of nif and glnA expression